MNYIKCDRQNCFACIKGNCRILHKAVVGKVCPFFQTEEELKDKQMKAMKRLKRLGRDDLIMNYAKGTGQYRIG